MSILRPATIILALFIATLTSAQNREELHCIGFYNLENFFDTIHDAGKNDYEFLPKGVNRWNSEKYTGKIKNIATTLASLGTEQQPHGATIVGVCEVENTNVLNDLIKSPSIARKGWKYIHIESEDSRGIDCALLYDPTRFTPDDKQLIPYGNNRKTRGFLTISGTIAGEQLHIIVNHWPSRYSKSPSREAAATKIRAIKDSIIQRHPTTKIIIMGDFNDNPDNKSLKENLQAKQEITDVKKKNDLYNPFWNKRKKEKLGTIVYRDHWQLYDQIIVSGRLCDKKIKGLKYIKSEIHRPPHLINDKGSHKGYPKRTHAGGEWLNGYSDHLPVVIYLSK